MRLTSLLWIVSVFGVLAQNDTATTADSSATADAGAGGNGTVTNAPAAAAGNGTAADAGTTAPAAAAAGNATATTGTTAPTAAGPTPLQCTGDDCCRPAGLLEAGAFNATVGGATCCVMETILMANAVLNPTSTQFAAFSQFAPQVQTCYADGLAAGADKTAYDAYVAGVAAPGNVNCQMNVEAVQQLGGNNSTAVAPSAVSVAAATKYICDDKPECRAAMIAGLGQYQVGRPLNQAAFGGYSTSTVCASWAATDKAAAEAAQTAGAADADTASETTASSANGLFASSSLLCLTFGWLLSRQ